MTRRPPKLDNDVDVAILLMASVVQPRVVIGEPGGVDGVRLEASPDISHSVDYRFPTALTTAFPQG